VLDDIEQRHHLDLPASSRQQLIELRGNPLLGRYVDQMHTTRA
jgi:hypothetical protein